MIISVEGAPGFDAVDHFDAADLHQPVAAAEAEPRRFSIEDDFTHSDTIAPKPPRGKRSRSEEHTSELQSLMRISYAVFCLKKKTYILLIITQINQSI